MNHGFTPIRKGGIKMGTKGPSNHYGNSSGGRQGSASKHISYSWAKDFNKRSLSKHFDEHAKHMGIDSEQSYKQHAIKFANDVDKKNYESFVDRKTNKTYKYSVKSNEFVIVDKKGYVVTYFKPKDGHSYYLKEKIKHTKKGK